MIENHVAEWGKVVGNGAQWRLSEKISEQRPEWREKSFMPRSGARIFLARQTECEVPETAKSWSAGDITRRLKSFKCLESGKGGKWGIQIGVWGQII